MTEPSVDQVTAVLNSSVQAPLEGLFQVALVLGGTVSTGAYTAGFLDKLIEALDAWYGAKEEKAADVPRHEVRLRIVTGASGGGVSAALLARMLPYGITPIRPGASAADREAHLLYHTWVNRLDITGMVNNDDLPPGHPPKSVLNGGGLKDAADAAVNLPIMPQPLPHAWPHRPYVDNPFRVVVTLGNLTGVPYTIPFEDDQHLTARAHADYARFACDISGAGISSLTLHKRPDEFLEAAGTPWETLATYATAGAAFPLILPPYKLKRSREHYDYRAVVVPDDKGNARVLPLRPQWSTAEEDYSFNAVDGGMFNNEPIELARTYLAGLTGRNLRDGSLSDRAVILVDPLSDPVTLGEAQAGGLADQGFATLDGFLQQSRFATSDLLLMADPTVFSRFLVSPRRDDVVGEKALAGGGLAGFIGFFEPAFRHHDYMLGRANCLKFLEEDFVLRSNNALFQNGRWTEAQRLKYGAKAGDEYLPIIPLVGTAAEPDPEVEWPRKKLTVPMISKRLKPRLEKVIQRAADGALNFPLSDLLIALVKGFGARAILSKIEAQAKEDLTAWRL